jgi:hypothetical protein
MQPGRGSILTTPMVIALMAFAIVAFLFLIDTSINPDNSNKTTTTTTQKKVAPSSNDNQNVNTADTTEGTFETNLNTNSTADDSIAE